MTVLSDEVLEGLSTLDAILTETEGSRFADDRVDCTSFAQDLQRALGSRSIVDRATGLLMAGLGYGAVDAFNLLCLASEDSERPIGLVAQAMVDAETRLRRPAPCGHRRGGGDRP